MGHKIQSFFALIVISLGVVSCSGNDEYNELPQSIAEFVSQYFPDQSVSTYGFNGETYHVKLKDGAGMSFDTQYKWITINGYGETLPAVLLFDQLPPAFYEYMQEFQDLSQVYSITRDDTSYTAVISASTLVYDIATAKVSISQPS